FLLVLLPRFRTRILLAFMACIAAAVVLFIAVPSNTSAFARLSGHDPSGAKSTDERLRVIDDAIDYGVQHPLTGIGFGRVLDSHSMPAQFFQAGGIVALATLGLWVFGIGRTGRRPPWGKPWRATVSRTTTTHTGRRRASRPSCPPGSCSCSNAIPQRTTTASTSVAATEAPAVAGCKSTPAPMSGSISRKAR